MTDDELRPPSEKPTDISGLFTCYHEYVKVLYSFVQTQNALPQETLFEINAAFDHLSRKYIYGEPDAAVVAKVYGHLKRSCLDIFKLQVKQAHDQYEALHRLDLSLVDNGEFTPKLNELFARITNTVTRLSTVGRTLWPFALSLTAIFTITNECVG